MSQPTLADIIANPDLLDDMSPEVFEEAFNNGISELASHIDAANLPEAVQPFVSRVLETVERQAQVAGNNPFAQESFENIRELLQGLLRQNENGHLVQLLSQAGGLMNLFEGVLPEGMSFEDILSSLPPDVAGMVGPMIVYLQGSAAQTPETPQAIAGESTPQTSGAAESMTVEYDLHDHTPGGSYIQMNADNIAVLGGASVTMRVYEPSGGDYADTERDVSWEELTEELGSDQLNFVTLYNNDGLAYVQVYAEGASPDDAITLGVFNEDMDFAIPAQAIAQIEGMSTAPEPDWSRTPGNDQRPTLAGPGLSLST